MRPYAALSAIAICILVDGEVANANGAFPESGQVVVDPADPDHLVATTTFGILTSTDRGGMFALVCEAAAGYANLQPPIAVAAGGAVLVALPSGVQVSTSAGCDWHPARGMTGIAIDVTVWAFDPNVAGAIGYDAASGTATYYESSNGGADFEATGGPLQEFLPTTLDIAPSDRDRIYVAGTTGRNNGVLARSRDHGATWELLDIPHTSSIAAPFIAAIDPADADRVYVRTRASPASLLYTTDGGTSWIEALTFNGLMSGAALSPDGSAFLAGGEQSGVWEAPTRTMEFTQVSEYPAKCLKWGDGGVFACEKLTQDGVILSLSTDEARTFEPLTRLGCLELLECARGTTVGDECDASANPIVADCGGAPGQGGSGGAPQGGTGGAAAQPPIESRGGCECMAAPSQTDHDRWFVLAALVLWATSRERSRVRRRIATALPRTHSHPD